MLTEKQITAFNHAIRSCADDLRAKGLTVAVHNDYRQDGESYTFWLMAFPDPKDAATHRYRQRVLSLKGEGKNDAEALDLIHARHAEIIDDLHHAPLCPANHYHGSRAPTGPCSCGAKDMTGKESQS